MDESWKMRLHAVPLPPPRRSMEDPTIHHRKLNSGDISDDPLIPEDFSDVFGGPPRTVLSRQFSTGFTRSSSSSSFFYEEIFRPQGIDSTATDRTGRSLKEFRIPRKVDHIKHNRENNGFYSDIFGWDGERVVRSRSRSKASSSSALSSEELSPLRTAVSSEDDVSLFGSKLRPINVRCHWNPSRMGKEDSQRQHSIHNNENDLFENFKNYPFGYSRRTTSPETIRLDPISNGSFIVSRDDIELNSQVSPVSSICQSEREQKHEILRQDIKDQEEDEVMRSYVIEINSDYREETCESNGVDEAIAWAKEKFQQQYEKEKNTEEISNGKQLSEGHSDSFESLDEQQYQWVAAEEIEPLESKEETEFRTLDEKIRLWSKGKETDIRLLLTSLHHILWPNSGWFLIPLTNIIESSKVKKAYQKARLCLHPDKLQQRGATLTQKYIAEKAFSILQDAWAAFTSVDVSLNSSR